MLVFSMEFTMMQLNLGSTLSSLIHCPLAISTSLPFGVTLMTTTLQQYTCEASHSLHDQVATIFIQLMLL